MAAFVWDLLGILILSGSLGVLCIAGVGIVIYCLVLWTGWHREDQQRKDAA